MSLAITEDELAKADNTKAVGELIDYHYKRTSDYLSAYSLFPLGDKKVIQWDSDMDCRVYIGWKATFGWKPTC